MATVTKAPANLAEATTLLEAKDQEVQAAYAEADKALDENDALKKLVAEARALSEAGGMTFGPLQQADFFAKIDVLLNPAKPVGQEELQEVKA
jgi:riboflavin biosynthesis pyrimidine reductase